ncbi:MAG: FeoB-associated Cys-rich membrane protein [Muribaculaceae bacterium]|nr:FeoB-associated Cys-rich membrane protein [Muribaculaceae bacterium]
MSTTIQYIIVSIIILCALTYMIVSIRRRCKQGGCSCGECSLSDACKNTKNKKPRG